MSRSTVSKARRRLQHFYISTQRSVRYVASGVMRIFSTAEDNYRKTGVQPFHGDPAKE